MGFLIDILETDVYIEKKDKKYIENFYYYFKEL